MATKKKPPAAAALPSRALEHGAKAFGAKYLRKGAALTPELDLAFALGYGSSVGPVTLLPDAAPGKTPILSTAAVQRNVALAELRRSPKAPPGPGAFEADPAPLEVDEAQTLLRTRMPKLAYRPVVLRAIEAMVGPSATLAAFVDGLESMPDASWNNGGVGALFHVVYGLLLRTPPAESNAARARLEALYEERKDQYGGAAIDIALHGREGIARRGYKYSTKFKSYQRNDSSDPSNVNDLCLCDGDPEFVAQQFAALWAAFKFKVQNQMNGPSPARLFFLGGEPTLETELKVVEQYPGTKQADAFESYRALRSPRVVALVEKLCGPKSKVKAQAEAWLAEHGGSPA